MRASVIVALHNKCAYVAQCVESVFAQTFKDKELIIVDDGSTDSSVKEVEKIISGRNDVTLLRQSNQGVGPTRNRAIASASGEFVLPLDADDAIDPRYLEKTIPLMQDGIGIVSTDMQRFGLQHELIRAEPRTLEQQLQSNMLPITSLVRRSVLEQVGGYQQVVDGWEDWDLWIRILRLGWRVAVVNEPLFHYRVVPDGLNAAADNRNQELLRRMRGFHPDFKGR